ncbi:MAG: hypothetical protein F7C32_01415 [Desulfurococcales archaeon]|nr:hypothetical protein [Desulfurococcales archaeon]
MEALEIVSGITGMMLVFIGYVLRLFERYTRPAALYHVAHYITVLAWLISGHAVRLLLFPGGGLEYFLLSLLLASPVIILGYVMLARRFRKRYVRLYGFVVVNGSNSPDRYTRGKR